MAQEGKYWPENPEGLIPTSIELEVSYDEIEERARQKGLDWLEHGDGPFGRSAFIRHHNQTIPVWEEMKDPQNKIYVTKTTNSKLAELIESLL